MIRNPESNIRTCSICNKEKTVAKYIENMPICQNCYSKNYRPKKTCSICHKEKVITKNIGDLHICQQCYDKSYRPKKTCSICYEERIIAKKVGDINYCRSCYSKFQAPKRICSQCGSEKKTAKIIDGKSICAICYAKNFRPKRICSICNLEKTTSKTVDGKSICPTCYKKHYRTQKICSICNEEKFIAKKVGEQNICESCYQKKYLPKRTCLLCNEVDITAKFLGQYSICAKCYKKFYLPKRICIVCNETNITAKIINGQSICPKCYKQIFKPKKECSICGEVRTITKNIGDKSFCQKCYTKYHQPKKDCSICGNNKIIVKIDSDKNICQTCYKKYYAPKRVCIICCNLAPTNKYIDGKSICQKCYDKHYRNSIICSICNTETVSYRIIDDKYICINCYIKDNEYHIRKFYALLENLKEFIIHKEVINLLDKFAQTLLEYRTAFYSYMILLNHDYIFKYIDKDNALKKGLSYDYFNIVEKSFDIKLSLILENFLIKEGVLSSPDTLEIFKNYQLLLLEKIPETFYEVFIKYTNSLIQYKGRFIRNGFPEKFDYKTFKEYCNTCCKFLIFLSNHIDNIIEINNMIIDEFLQINRSLYFPQYLRRFFRWVNTEYKLFRKLKLPKLSKTEYRNIYSEEEILSIIDLIDNTANSFRDKALCYLLLFYAIRPTELSKLKISDYVQLNDSSLLKVRNTWITINPSISAIIDQYITNERNSELSLGSDIDWMFFGFHYNKSLSAGSIRLILKKYNILVPEAFSTVISNIFIQSGFTPSILIKGIGLNPCTAISYYKSIGINNLDTINTCLINTSNMNQSTRFYVYILRCCDNSYYTGYTSNITQRLNQHQNGIGCVYTKTRTPVELVYLEEVSEKSLAIKREKQIKKLNLFDKERLIEKGRIN